MGRDARKATGNVWYEARINAAKYNDAFYSREKVAEKMGCSESVIRNIENDTYKFFPVENAVGLADIYNAPYLRNHYCNHECPIGRYQSISDEAVDIDRSTIKLLGHLRNDALEKMKSDMLSILQDGVISEDEEERFENIVSFLKEIAKVISEIVTLWEMVRNRRK